MESFEPKKLALLRILQILEYYSDIVGNTGESLTVDCKEVVTSDFEGASAIYHCFTYMRDSTGEVYTEEEAIKEFDAIENSGVTLDDFMAQMQAIGVRNIICTDISKDGAMRGTNLELYRELSAKYSMDITASGGVSSMNDVKELRKMQLYGAIIGKAYYTGDIDLRDAVEVAK